MVVKWRYNATTHNEPSAEALKIESLNSIVWYRREQTQRKNTGDVREVHLENENDDLAGR
jgi:hypothetical protein